MGWQARSKVAAEKGAKADALLLARRLAGLHVAVDVQHLYRPAKPADRGAEFVLNTGHKITEAEIATGYAQALASWLRERGAAVLTNNPATNTLVGPYSRRNLEAVRSSCDVYLACHVNAGGGNYGALEFMASSASRPLADAIGIALVARVPEIPRVRQVQLSHGQRGAVCIERFTGGPALLLEPFFGDYAPAQGLVGPARLMAIGQAIGEGIAAWWLHRSRAAAQDAPGSPNAGAQG